MGLIASKKKRTAETELNAEKTKSCWLSQNRQVMTRAKATTTGPLDLHVRELWRREETDTEEGHGEWWFRY